MAQRALALERAAAALAASAQEGAEILDLVAMEELEHESDVTVEHVDVAEPEMDIEDEPLQSVSELAEDATDDENLPATRYQKSTGLPLKERIKIARMSG